MTKRLFDRQARLLEYLTSGEAIFGERDGQPLDQCLQGIDRSLLRLEARFSHEKRMGKIASVFRRTFEVLGPNRELIVQEFVETCRPTDISRSSNARQFFEFLSGRWHGMTPDPPYLCDLAACELACERVRADAEIIGRATAGRAGEAPVRSIRRRRGIVLIRCKHDIRAVFERGNEASVKARDTPLAIAMPPGADQPQIFELTPTVFTLLADLDDWVDPALFGNHSDEMALIDHLCGYGLLEARVG
jgi:hypothetical protein